MVQNREIDFEYMLTGEIIADYFTIPLQGNLFRNMRDQIQRIDANHLELYKRQYDEAMKTKAARPLKQYNLRKSLSYK